MKLNKLQFKLVHKACDDIKEWIQEKIWGKFAFVGYVTNGSTFPTHRINCHASVLSDPLEIGDYVKVNPKTTEFPFTIDDVTFTNKWQIARYNGNGSWKRVDKEAPYYIFRDWVKDLRVSQDYGCTWENLGAVTPNITGTAEITGSYGKPQAYVVKQPKREDDIDFNYHFIFENINGVGIDRIEYNGSEEIFDEDKQEWKTRNNYTLYYQDDRTQDFAIEAHPARINERHAIFINGSEDISFEETAEGSGVFVINTAKIREDLDNEITRATNAETALNTKIEEETTRATTEEQRIEDKLDTEITNAKQAGHTFELTENDNDNVRSITLTVKDRENNPLLNKTLNNFVLTGRTIAGHSLADDITAQNLQDAIKDLNAILTHKTISADNNTISDLVVGNFKSGVVRTSIRQTGQASDANLATEKAIRDAIRDAINDLPEPMVFKGSLGEGGTITALPDASSENEGYTYKVITAGTYAGQEADKGDTFISDGNEWALIPSGDEPSGTVTNIEVGNGLQTTNGEPITDTGKISVKLANNTGLGFDANGALQVLLDQGLGFNNGKIRAEIGQGMMYDNNKLKIKTKNNGGINVDSDGIFIDFDTTMPSTPTDYKAPTTKTVYDYIQNLINNNITFGGTVTATAFYQSSDERLKDKVGDLELDRCKELLDIPAILYKLKSDETNKVQIGTIAQEVQKVMPELVQEDKEGHLGVAYDRMPIVCLELLKDAYKQIAELKQEVEQLKFK